MISIRPLLAGDAEAAHELHALCFETPWPAQAFVSLAETGAFGYSIDDNSRITGLILARAVLDEAEILSFAVHPDHRCKGYGLRLMLQLMADLECQNIKKLFLEVASCNQAALSLYRNLGFVEIGTRTNYYSGAFSVGDALVMEKKIGVH